MLFPKTDCQRRRARPGGPFAINLPPFRLVVTSLFFIAYVSYPPRVTAVTDGLILVGGCQAGDLRSTVSYIFALVPTTPSINDPTPITVYSGPTCWNVDVVPTYYEADQTHIAMLYSKSTANDEYEWSVRAVTPTTTSPSKTYISGFKSAERIRIVTVTGTQIVCAVGAPIYPLDEIMVECLDVGGSAVLPLTLQRFASWTPLQSINSLEIFSTPKGEVKYVLAGHDINDSPIFLFSQIYPQAQIIQEMTFTVTNDTQPAPFVGATLGSTGWDCWAYVDFSVIACPDLSYLVRGELSILGPDLWGDLK